MEQKRYGTDLVRSQLINITTNEEGKQLVNARELYIGLGLNKAAWSRWYKTNIIENDFFSENIDWAGVQLDVEGNETMDFAISLEFAKHIAMMARTEKSHQYRNYFIKCEKKAKNELALDTSELSPELQMFNKMFNSLAKNELEQKKMKQQIDVVNTQVIEAKEEVTKSREEIQAIREVVAINSSDWKNDCKKLITKIAYELGGINHINDVYKEVYSTLDRRLGTKLQTRLTNKRRRMADEGVCKSKRDKLNYINVIEDDKKLIEGYVAIVKELAIKNGVGGNRNE
ncbi:MAG: antA/AntB antirepressor family protein [Coprobacillus sp.]